MREGNHLFFVLDNKNQFATSECEIESLRAGTTVIGLNVNHLSNALTSKVNITNVEKEKIVLRKCGLLKFDLSFWLQDNPRRGRGGQLKRVELVETLELSIHHQSKDGVLIDTLDKLNIICHFFVENVSATFNLEFVINHVCQVKKTPIPPYLEQLMKEEREKMPIRLLNVLQLIPELSVSETCIAKSSKKKTKWKPILLNPKNRCTGRPG